MVAVHVSLDGCGSTNPELWQSSGTVPIVGPPGENPNKGSEGSRSVFGGAGYLPGAFAGGSSETGCRKAVCMCFRKTFRSRRGAVPGTQGYGMASRSPNIRALESLACETICIGTGIRIDWRSPGRNPRVGNEVHHRLRGPQVAEIELRAP